MGADRRVRRLLANRSPAAVFLCWHSVADDGPPFLSVPGDRFERQVVLLRRLGYRSGNSGDLAALAAGAKLDAPRAFVTFDDGFADNCSTALPILQEHGLRPMIFVIPPLLEEGAAFAWPEVEARRRAHPGVMRSMTWDMVDRVVEAGGEIGNHTCTHPRLSSLPGEALLQELSDARARVRERVGSCETVAYPFGDWSERVARAAADTGHRFGFTMPKTGQRAGAPLAIPRIAVDHRDDERRLRLKLSAAGRRAVLSPTRALAARIGRPPASA